MTDEEKEAIKYFKETYWYFGEEEIKANVDILLSFIEKQQKEIDKLTAESTEFESEVYDLQDEIEELNRTLKATQNSWFKDTQTIEGYKTYTEIERANNKQISEEIKKRDKIIDLMCEKFAGQVIYEDDKLVADLRNKEEVKQYFEKEASKDD